jgi:hypothetical protein
MHEGKSLHESMELNARLILCLINHIGNLSIIAHAVDVASGKVPGRASHGLVNHVNSKPCNG